MRCSARTATHCLTWRYPSTGSVIFRAVLDHRRSDPTLRYPSLLFCRGHGGSPWKTRRSAWRGATSSGAAGSSSSNGKECVCSHPMVGARTTPSTHFICSSAHWRSSRSTCEIWRKTPTDTPGSRGCAMRYKSYLDGKHFRARAEECRTIAELFSNPDARAKMLRVAADYERMALTADERERGAE